MKANSPNLPETMSPHLKSVLASVGAAVGVWLLLLASAAHKPLFSSGDTNRQLSFHKPRFSDPKSVELRTDSPSTVSYISIQFPMHLGNGDSNSNLVSSYPLEFVHITKTGGTSIEAAAAKSGIVWGACKFKRNRAQCSDLNEFDDVSEHFKERRDWRCRRYQPIESWHCPPTEFQSRKNLYSGSNTFVVVRNPYDRIISEFFYLRDVTYRSDHWFKDAYGNEVLQSEYDTPQFFNSWIIQALESVEIKGSCENGHCIPMHKYTHNSENERIVDHILRLEKISVEFPALMQKYGLPMGDLAHDNVRQEHGEDQKVVNKITKFGFDDLEGDTIRKINEWAKLDFEYFDYEMIVP